MSELAKKIASLRKKIGQTQPEFAKKIGVSRRSIQDYERAISEPRASIVQKIAEVGNVSLDWLLSNETHEMPMFSQTIEIIKRDLGIKTDSEIAELLELTDTAFDYHKSIGKTPFRNLALFCEKHNFSLSWLLTGEGLVKSSSRSEEPKQKQEAQPPATKYFSTNMVELKVYESAGAGSAIELWEAEPIEVIAVESWRIKNGAHALRVDGTSMEPTIMQGAIVLIQNHEVKLVDGGIYLLRIPHEGLIIKRVYLGYKELILRSDNGTYPEIKLPLDDGWDLQDIVIGKIDTVLIQGVK